MKTIRIQAEYLVLYERKLEMSDEEFERLKEKLNTEGYEAVAEAYIDFKDNVVGDFFQEDGAVISLQNEDGSFSEVFRNDA